MSFSGGVYTLPGPALVTGEVVSATENNQFRNDVAGAFNLTMLRNGTSTATANLPMGGYKLTGLGAPNANGDSLAYGAAAVVTTLTSTSLTAARVPYAGTGGLLQDASTFTFDGTTLTAGGFSTAGSITVSGGTANGVAYLNGSKVLTTGSDLVFDGVNIGLGVTPSAWGGFKALQIGGATYNGVASTNGYLLLAANAYYDGSAFKYTSSNAASTYTQNGGAHYWNVAGSGTAGNAISFTQAMTLNANGNLGIGTNSPGMRLDVAATQSIIGLRSTGAFNSSLNFYSSSSTLEAGLVSVAGGATLLFTTGSSGTERMRINSSGNVGIGSTSPDGRLEVSNSCCIRWGLTDASWVNEYSTNPAKNAYVGHSSDALQHYWKCSNTNRMNLTSNGLGVTAPFLTVTDNDQTTEIYSRYAAGVEQYTYIKSRNGSGSGFQPMYLGATSLYQSYQPNGAVIWAVTTTGGNTSDRSVKTGLTPISNALEKICKLGGYTFEFTDEYKSQTADTTAKGEQLGVVADEVEKVFPQIVHYVNDLRRVNYEKLVAPLIEAIKELKTELDATKTEVAALKNTAA